MLKKLLDIFFSSDPEHLKKELTGHELNINKLQREFESKFNSPWNYKLTAVEFYASLKSESGSYKKSLLKFLIKDLAVSKAKSRKSEKERSREKVTTLLLSSIIRQKIDFEETELINLINSLFTYTKSHKVYFNEWPFGYAIIQVEKHVKKQGLSATMTKYLKDLLKNPELKKSSSYWGTDMEKVQLKINDLLFHANSSAHEIPPYYLNESDLFGQYVNGSVKIMPEVKQNAFFQIFRLALKASGSKPSKRFLDQSKKIVDEIGIKFYKSTLIDWFSFLSEMKESEINLYHDNNPDVPYYSYFNFLEDKNSVLAKGLVWSLVRFHDVQTLAILARLAERAYKKIPGIGAAAAAIGNACIFALANSRGLDGVGHLSRIKMTVRQANTQKLIQKYIDQTAVALNITPEEVEDLSVPDFGLTEGAKVYQFDNYQFEVQITGIGKISQKWLKPDLTVQKTTPAFVKSTEKHTQKLKKARAELKQIRKQLTAQRDRIDRSFINDRKWFYEHFESRFLNHGLMCFLTRKLILDFFQKKISKQRLFGPMDIGKISWGNQ